MHSRCPTKRKKNTIPASEEEKNRQRTRDKTASLAIRFEENEGEDMRPFYEAVASSPQGVPLFANILVYVYMVSGRCEYTLALNLQVILRKADDAIGDLLGRLADTPVCPDYIMVVWDCAPFILFRLFGFDNIVI